MISKNEVLELATKFGKNPKDTGNTAVQVAILTTRINNLKTHFAANKHDYHSNRGLLKLIGKRRRLLRYVAKNDRTVYPQLIQDLGLRK
ncbi:MAG: 30S ribosomal protein S15 [Bacteriovoracaceae bacterium]|jgi:small subunit ribosomal protein S15|nr:30S ribosomal protein S15 [Bacteriovoracaceae bacterium]